MCVCLSEDNASISGRIETKLGTQVPTSQDSILTAPDFFNFDRQGAPETKNSPQGQFRAEGGDFEVPYEVKSCRAWPVLILEHMMC